MILPIVTLILEILPYGAVCIFATCTTERFRKTFSYFDPVPYGYANVTPLLTAIITCAVLVLLIIYWINGNVKLAAATRITLMGASVLSLGPLLFGVEYFTLVGSMITLSFIAELLLLQFTIKR